MKSPAETAAVGNEFSHQAAVFMWANMAANFGVAAANDEASYKIAGHAAAFGTWRNDRLPALAWLHAIKNQGHGDVIRGARSKQEGVKAGVPDMFLPQPVQLRDPCGDVTKVRCGLYIEMKIKGGVVSDDQIKWHKYLSEVGYDVTTCWTWKEARDVLLSYLGYPVASS